MNFKDSLHAATFLALFSCIFALFSSVPISGSKDGLQADRLLHVTGAVGPESLVFDSHDEGPYTGVADGRILKYEGEERGWTEFAVTSSNRSDCVVPFAPELEHICGRPLGLRFDKKNGDLYIVDAYLGLNVVGPAGGLATQLATEAEGQPFRFNNDMDISEDEDVIYFTDSSTVYQRRQIPLLLLSGDKTGRLMKYVKSTKEVKVLLSGLNYPNGVCLSKDGLFLLVGETSTFRILRLWLHGPNAGQVNTFAVLPGYPDNIRRNSDGQFWVALHNAAIKLSDEGEILEIVEGKTMRYVSEADEKDGKLLIGSVLMPYIGIYSL
ncbi:putative strictosidine synthase transcription factor WD40-like family [Medicago truncatula]|uniref:Putative strictosidine synthase transcription factor WD40-like family n=1 Tax=Medicago truncatula TaxID=3880 RepID=G7K3F5_MEDTR|nr:protein STRICTOSIDINE SYNTHASE-LIKE 10-like [Medicago truncatula]AET00433.1 strictosidine synthase-like protein [Medicago truncatula]RHN57727.1 putative strictosidine synthase transcription factor WD40-like family [Medicago truncatula]